MHFYLSDLSFVIWSLQPHYIYDMDSIGARSSKSDKVNYITQMLCHAHMSFGELIRAWIECTPGEPTGKARQFKARQLLDIIWDDMLPLFEKTDTFQERVTAPSRLSSRSWSSFNKTPERLEDMIHLWILKKSTSTKYTMRLKCMNRGFCVLSKGPLLLKGQTSIPGKIDLVGLLQLQLY